MGLGCGKREKDPADISNSLGCKMFVIEANNVEWWLLWHWSLGVKFNLGYSICFLALVVQISTHLSSLSVFPIYLVCCFHVYLFFFSFLICSGWGWMWWENLDRPISGYLFCSTSTILGVGIWLEIANNFKVKWVVATSCKLNPKRFDIVITLALGR